MAITSLEQYLESLNENGKYHVEQFVQFMTECWPQKTHKICFSMPMWLFGTKMNEGYVAISAAKNHISIHFSDEEFLQHLAKQLPTCKTGKRCINVRYGDTASLDLVKGAVITFLKQNKITVQE